MKTLKNGTFTAIQWGLIRPIAVVFAGLWAIGEICLSLLSELDDKLEEWKD